MSRRVRLAMFALAGPGLLAVLVIGMRGLPSFGHYHGVYGLTINHIALKLRHATNYVTALNFDIRAFDTLGEEFILFASVAGVAVLLRHLRHEEDVETSRGIEDHTFAGASDALRLGSMILIPLLIALGGYVVLHGALTPGGGFQGGVVLAAAPIAIVLAGRYLTMRRAAPDWVLEATESAGAAGYALMGLAGLILAGVYLKNFLPLGTPGMLLSAGMIPLNSIAVGLEVAGAFLIAWTEFFDQALIAGQTG
ncbi:MAG TPA: MnhB domain-containing protein [Solirubrobacteraceae bacterium]